MSEAYDINQEFEETTAADAGYTSQQANAIAQIVTDNLERNRQMQQPSIDTAATAQPSNETQTLLLQSINMLQEQVLQMQQDLSQRKRNKNNNNPRDNNNNFGVNKGKQVTQGQHNNFFPNPQYAPPFFGQQGFPGQPHVHQQSPLQQWNPSFPPTPYHPLPQGPTFPPAAFPPGNTFPTQQQNVNNPFQTNNRFRQPNPRGYCWSHGWCGHTGATCRTPAPGHQPQATLENRMNGSNKNCT